MMEPLKYGMPLSFAYLGLFAAQVQLDLMHLTFIRWLIAGGMAAVCIILIGLFIIRNMETFVSIWFYGFTIYIVANIGFSAWLFVFQKSLFPSDFLTDPSAILYVMFVEFVSQLTIGLIIHTVGAFIYSKLKKDGA